MLGYISNAFSNAVFGKKRHRESSSPHSIAEKILRTRGAIFVDLDGTIKINECSRNLISSLASHSRDCAREMRELGCNPTPFGPLTLVREPNRSKNNKCLKAQRNSKTTAKDAAPTSLPNPSSTRSIMEDALQGRVFTLAGKTTPVYSTPGSVSFIDIAGNTTIRTSNEWCDDVFKSAASSGAAYVQVPNIIGSNFKIYAVQQDAPCWRRPDGTVPSTSVGYWQHQSDIIAPSTSVVPGPPRTSTSIPPTNSASPDVPDLSVISTKVEPPSTQAPPTPTQDVNLTPTQVAPIPKARSLAKQGPGYTSNGNKRLFDGNSSPNSLAGAPVVLPRNFRSPENNSTFRLGQHSGENWK